VTGEFVSAAAGGKYKPFPQAGRTSSRKTWGWRSKKNFEGKA
jgi:hypothetical protein